MISNRLAWKSLGSSARNTLAWARGLYRAARSPHGAAAAARLEHCQWLSASAEACVLEARRLYQESLESLLRSGIRVRREEEAGRVRFVCRALDGAAEPFVRFAAGRPDAAEPALLERWFGADEIEPFAFGQGLDRLDALGAFAGGAELQLRPDPPATALLPAAEPRRRAGAALRRYRQRQPASLPLRQA